MPLEQDPHHGGTEKDGTHSMKYCSLCYENEDFIDKDCTIEKMQEIVAELTQKM